MAVDRLQYNQGKQHAVSMLQNIGVMLQDPKTVTDALRNLESSCINWPRSYSAGVMDVVAAVRQSHVPAN